MNPRRRRLTAGLAALAIVPRHGVSDYGANADDAQILSRLKGLINNRTSALLVGTAVLECSHGSGARGEFLRRLLEHNRSRFGRARSEQDLALRLRDAVLRDFDNGRTVSVRGLVLAATEANLCALIALDAMTEPPGPA